MKTCNECHEHKPLGDFYSSNKSKVANATTPQGTVLSMCILCHKANGKRAHYVRTYGITMEDAQSLLDSQDGECAICTTPLSITESTACVDHDHLTGAVRGMLCRQCNGGIGLLQDSREVVSKALAYLTY